uniref:Uncharacterized protein n=1 Tax=Onchocerca volvulus TaxID=6282 RepID=A0A8R1TNB5_ONCVO
MGLLLVAISCAYPTEKETVEPIDTMVKDDIDLVKAEVAEAEEADVEKEVAELTEEEAAEIAKVLDEMEEEFFASLLFDFILDLFRETLEKNSESQEASIDEVMPEIQGVSAEEA